MLKNRRGAWCVAAALASASGCGALATGRCVSAFFAQTGGASWLGVAVSCILFGAMMGGLLRLRRKTCAGSLPEIYLNLFGRRAGGALLALHAVFLALVLCALLSSAGHTAALVLPIHHAALFGVLLALPIALWLSGSGGRRLMWAGCLCFALLLCLCCALLLGNDAPAPESIGFYVRLKLENNASALLLGAIHASLAAAICAPMAVKLYPLQLKPSAAGMLSALASALLLVAQNAVFVSAPAEINALRYPFAALSVAWGKAGFYACSIAHYLETLVSIGAVFCLCAQKPTRQRASL